MVKRITSKRKFKKVLADMFKSAPFVPDSYIYVCESKCNDFNIKTFKGRKVVCSNMCPANTIYLMETIFI